MHLKHCSSDHNTSRDLEFDKNVPRLVTTGAINLKKKQPEGNTLLCFEYLFYINTQVQMLKSFNGLVIQKFKCVSTGNILPEFFFQPTVGASIFLGTIFFLMHIGLQDIFCQNDPPPPKVKWLVPNSRGQEHLLGL